MFKALFSNYMNKLWLNYAMYMHCLHAQCVMCICSVYTHVYMDSVYMQYVHKHCTCSV